MLSLNEVLSLLRMPRPKSVPLGVRGERLAVRFLRRQGYKIVACNWADTLGELDIVAVDGRTIVFVEVKTWSQSQESPSLAVDDDKQTRLTRLALRFLKHHDLLECSARFDVVAIRWQEKTRPTIDHIRNAFEPKGRWQFFS